MKKENKMAVDLSAHMGCYGNFCIGDPLCKSYCALNIRCAIEHHQIIQMEVLEDLVSQENMALTVQ